MSSPEDESQLEQVVEEVAKPKKKPRACDHCRRKKSDGAEMPDHRCSRCTSQKIECTYEPTNNPSNFSYVHVLENRLQNMEKLFSMLHPNVPIPNNFNGTLEPASFQPLQESHPSSSAHSNSSEPGVTHAPTDPPHDDEREAQLSVLDSLKRLRIPDGLSVRYHGKSSHLMFLRSVIDLKQEYTGEQDPRSADATMRDSHGSSLQFQGAMNLPRIGPDGRPKYTHAGWAWSVHRKPRPPYRDFPPADLMERLIDAYFTHHNTFMPLLHRPTLEQGIRDGLHLREQGFGGVLLLVCANGSRWVDDPRLTTDGHETPGWKWFMQVEDTRWSFLERPRLEDLQTCVLMASCLGGSNCPQGSWNLVGMGLRMAQDVGVHRKKMYGSKPTVEDELWKRAFWGLVCMDRAVSFGLGRPCAIHDEDVDCDLLAEVDDEYWIHPDPELAFKQPEGKPSRVAFINCFIKLINVLTFALRTIYSTNKWKVNLGYVGPEWEQKIVAELDSALNKWVDAVPEHLRWDPDRSDPVFMNQSAALYANYYFIQICIHRPFIPSSRKHSRHPFPSLAICTNAARSCTHVINIQFERTGVPLLLNRNPLFSAALVLLLNVWGAKRSGLAIEAALNDLYMCVNSLKRLEAHTCSARRVREVLIALMSAGEFPMPGESQFTGTTRPNFGTIASVAFAKDAVQSGFANAQPAQSSSQNASSSSGGQTTSHQSADGMQGVSTLYSSTERLPNMVQPSYTTQTDDMFTEPTFTLPLYTQELGRLPFHHGFHSSQPFPDAAYGSQQQQLGAGSQAGAAHPAGMSMSPGPPADDYTVLMNTPSFPMHIASYRELLFALSMTTSSPGTHTPSAHTQMHSTNGEMGMPQPQTVPMTVAMEQNENSALQDMDVSMSMSAEDLAFADNMMEMWATAPISLEMDDWGPYLSSIVGADPDGFEPPTPPPGGYPSQ
ncbi:fungal-specific transcription factor domain-containing protein [Daedaleopsis nitida]|nr:fungal-specific transcription factor domain-containing protein [Daedaleopsis nitida]